MITTSCASDQSCSGVLHRLYFKHNNGGSTYCPLIQLVPPIKEEILAAVPRTSKFSKFPRMTSSSPNVFI